MPLRENNTTVFHRCTYAGELEKITLLKRENDQRQGIVRSVILFQCRRSMIFKQGESIQNAMMVDHRCVWHLPKNMMKRAGVQYINSLDRIVDRKNRYWQPESTTLITEKLFGNHFCIACLRVDPPGPEHSQA